MTADKTRFGQCVRDFCNFQAFNLAMRIPYLELNCIANSFVSISIYRSQILKTLQLMIQLVSIINLTGTC